MITFWLTDMEVDVVSTKHVVFRFHLSELECTVQPSIAWNYYGIAVAGLPNHLTPFPKGKPYIYIMVRFQEYFQKERQSSGMKYKKDRKTIKVKL